MGDYHLVTRECLCKCGGVFRVLPNSGDYYASVTHRPDFHVAFFKKEMSMDYLRRVKRWISEMYEDVESPDNPPHSLLE